MMLLHVSKAMIDDDYVDNDNDDDDDNSNSINHDNNNDANTQQFQDALLGGRGTCIWPGLVLHPGIDRCTHCFLVLFFYFPQQSQAAFVTCVYLPKQT